MEVIGKVGEREEEKNGERLVMWCGVGGVGERLFFAIPVNLKMTVAI